MKLVIIFSAMASAGKSSIARMVADKYKLKFHDAGDILKFIAKDEGFKVTENEDWWDTEEGMRFLKKRSEDQSFDKKIDKKLIELAEEGNAVFTSWTLPWIYGKGISVWLHASVEVRAKRLAGRDNIPYEEALKLIKERDEKNNKLYKSLYNIDYGNDLKPFDIIIDTDNMSKQNVLENVSKAIDKIIEDRNE